MALHIESIKLLEELVPLTTLPRFSTTDEHKLGNAPMDKPVEYAQISCLKNNFNFAPYNDSFVTLDAYVIGIGQLHYTDQEQTYDYIIASMNRIERFQSQKRDEDYPEEFRKQITLIPLRFLESYKTLN